LRRDGGVNAPVGSGRKLVANCVHTADATELDSCVASASAVSSGHQFASGHRPLQWQAAAGGSAVGSRALLTPALLRASEGWGAIRAIFLV